MKKYILTATCITCILLFNAASAKADINKKVLQSFHTVFTRASNIKWVEYPDHYFVSFNQNDILIRANYDFNGNILNSIRYYKEQHLPLNILLALKKSYPAKKVNVVTELSSPEGIVYNIQLKDEQYWTIIRSNENGNFEVVDKFRDANYGGANN